MSFFAVTKEELGRVPDIVLVTGDAYVDHPSFGIAVIGHILESNGYTVGIIPRPDMNDPHCMEVFGEPKIGFFINSGNMDSMVNNYTVAKKKRKEDLYAPNGKYGGRPDYALSVYSRRIRSSYPDVPIIAGGLEASLRRLAHYDYWSDQVRQSVLLESGADILCWGMGERTDLEIANALKEGTPVSEINWVRGTVWKADRDAVPEEAIFLPSYEDICKDKKKYAKSFMRQYRNCDAITAKPLADRYVAEDCYVVVNPPQAPLTTEEMDAVYELPYERTYHPMYEPMGGVPSIQEVKFSLASCRGCFGGCSFCALTFHQGRTISSRSHESLFKEAEMLTKFPDFKGYIHDVGGPTANFRKPSCQKQLKHGVCPNRECLGQHPCPNLEADHSDYIELLRKLREVPGVKKVFVRSGIRFDYIEQDPNGTQFLEELVRYHVSGQLKVAPEHVADHVLALMGKPKHEAYLRFKKQYERMNKKVGKKQYLVPYFISSHPGCTLQDAVELAEYFRDTHCSPEQVQDFYPTPGTLSTCMYYTGLDPRTMKPIYIAKDPREKELQRALMQYRIPENASKVREALRKAGRLDLIGNGPKCLVSSERKTRTNQTRNGQSEKTRAERKKRNGKGEHAAQRPFGKEKK